MRGRRSVGRPRTVVVTVVPPLVKHRAAPGGPPMLRDGPGQRQPNKSGPRRAAPASWRVLLRTGPSGPWGRRRPAAQWPSGPGARCERGGGPYFPQHGNDGIDVLHYAVGNGSPFRTGRLHGRTVLDVRAPSTCRASTSTSCPATGSAADAPSTAAVSGGPADPGKDLRDLAQPRHRRTRHQVTRRLRPLSHIGTTSSGPVFRDSADRGRRRRRWLSLRRR